MRVGKSYFFSAAHHLIGVDDDHPCARVHGHNYRVDVTLKGFVDPKTGFAGGMDFHHLDWAMTPLVKRLDHRDLNEIINNPTAERIAIWFFDNLQGRNLVEATLVSIRVWETDKCWAEYGGGE